MGTWEGKYIKGDKCEVPKEKIKAFFANFFQCGTMPEGENADQVCARTQEFFRELIRKDIDGTVLVSTHGFAMRALLNPLYDNRSDFWQGHVPYNCAVNIVEVQNGQCHLVGDEKIYYDKSLTYDRYIKIKS
jgi:broad specificity phosphatase PhoE